MSISNAVPILHHDVTRPQLDYRSLPDHRDGTLVHLDSSFLPDQTHVDDVPRSELPDEFVNIATRIDRLNLRAMVLKDYTERKIKAIVKELFGKAKPDDATNDTQKDKQLNRRDVDLATVGDAVNDDKENKRVKRQDVDIATLCPDMSCIGLLKQYEQWRKEHGYAYYTGVWKVGK